MKMMKTPKEKYLNDPQYHRFVLMLEALIEDAQFTPSEIREMCMLACINHEMRCVRGHRTNPIVDDALRVLIDFTDTPNQQG